MTVRKIRGGYPDGYPDPGSGCFLGDHNGCGKIFCMVTATFKIEKTQWDKGRKLICGIDEVGRGCFAGPVVVGGVIFPKIRLMFLNRLIF